MKRGAAAVSPATDCVVAAKRFCSIQQQQERSSEMAKPCSSAAPMQPLCVHKGMVLAQACGIKPQLATAAVEHVLEQTLSEADAALHLTLHAMSLATQIYECGSPDAADRALNIAEQALAATVQQLARAQALVIHKVRVQALGAAAAAGGLAAQQDAEEDADLQDTCSSSFSCCSTDQH